MRELSTGQLDGILVLLVDDEPDGRGALAVFLEHEGALVATADTADAALRLLKTLRVDVIVSDLAMPGKNGLDFLRDLRTRHDDVQPIPAIAYTGFSGWQADALAAGYQAYFVKPVDPAVLAAEVARLRSASVQR